MTHLDKIYWPKEKITKGELLDYYKGVAPYLLPHVKNRPIVLHRYPNGITGQSFYQKDLENAPKGFPRFAVPHENRTVHYPLIKDVSSLLYLVNLGSIEIHPFNSTIKKLHSPTFCVIDLDPEKIPFSAVVEVALAVHETLDHLGVPNYCKTSGGRGLHIYIPTANKYTFEQVLQFARLIVTLVHKKLPKITSLERSPAKRQKRVYLDFLQNHFGQTMAAPYSVRAKPGALVSTPLKWSEVKKGLDPTQFTMKNTLKRLKEKGDLFLPVLGKGISLPSLLKKFASH